MSLNLDFGRTPSSRAKSRLKRAVLGLALLVGACAPAFGEGPLTPLPEGPRASPLPAGVPPLSAWHQAALGTAPEAASASLADIASCIVSTKTPLPELDLGLRRGWAQVDTVWAGSRTGADTTAQVCVFHPPAGAVPHLLRNVRPLPSGVLEGTLVEVSGEWLTEETVVQDGATFLLAGGVVVVARGTALLPTRALLARQAAPPAPLPMDTDVAYWTLWFTSTQRLVWRLRGGTHVRRETYGSPAEAADAASRSQAVFSRIEQETPEPRRTRVWWHGAEMFELSPP
jgi:hypothetical protein